MFFFSGCKHAVDSFKKEIEKQYREELAELKLCLAQFEEAFVAGEEITKSGYPIKERINNLKTEIAEIEHEGINENYWVEVDQKVKEGDTYILNKYRLYVDDINELNTDIKRVENELFNKVQQNENKENLFSTHLNSVNNETIIKKIMEADRSTPKKIYIILKALFDNGILLLSDNETVFKAYFNEFSYQKSYETLKRGLNNYDFRKQDKKNQQSIDNLYFYLIS